MNPKTKHQFWAELIEQHSQSKLSAAAFCEAHQITPHTFYYWRKKLSHAEPKQTLHPLIIEEPASHACAQQVTLSLPSGITVQLPVDLPQHQIQHWLRALQC